MSLHAYSLFQCSEFLVIKPVMYCCMSDEVAQVSIRKYNAIVGRGTYAHVRSVHSVGPKSRLHGSIQTRSQGSIGGVSILKPNTCLPIQLSLTQLDNFSIYPKAEYMSTDTTQLNSTGQFLSTCLRLVSFMSVQLNTTGVFRHVLDLKLNSTELICALRHQF
jgi:hypothetical protein